MATDKTNNLTAFLTDIATTIRTAEGTTGVIDPQDFSDRIEALPATVRPNVGRAETTLTVTADDTNDKLTIAAANNQGTGYVTGANKTASTTVTLTASGKTVTATATDGTKVSKDVGTVSRASTTITTTADDTADTLTVTASNNQGTGYVTGSNKTATTTVTLTASGATVTATETGGKKVSKSVSTVGRANTTLTSSKNTTNNTLDFTASNNQGTGYVTGANKTATKSVSLSTNGATVTASDGTNSISTTVASVSGSIGGTASGGSATAAINNVNSMNTITDLTNKTAGTDYFTVQATATGTAGGYTPKYTVTTGGYIGSTVTGTKQTVSVSSDSTGKSIHIPKAAVSVGGSASNGKATATISNVNNMRTISSASGTAGTDYFTVKATATGTAGGYTPSMTVSTAGYLKDGATGTKQTVSVSSDSTGKSIMIPKASFTVDGRSVKVTSTGGGYVKDGTTVGTISNSYIIPTGTKTISSSGTHDVTSYASATVAAGGSSVSGGALTSGSGSVSASGTNVSLIEVSTPPTTGPYITVTGSGSVSRAAITKTQTAGYIEAGTTTASNATSKSSNTATKYYAIQQEGSVLIYGVYQFIATPTIAPLSSSTSYSDGRPDGWFGWTNGTSGSPGTVLSSPRHELRADQSPYGFAIYYDSTVVYSNYTLGLVDYVGWQAVDGVSTNSCRTIIVPTPITMQTTDNFYKWFSNNTERIGDWTGGGGGGSSSVEEWDASTQICYDGPFTYLGGAPAEQGFGVYYNIPNDVIIRGQSADQCIANVWDKNFLAENIKSGVNIFGKTGTYTGSGGGSGNLFPYSPTLTYSSLGATYGFTEIEDGYYESTNKGVNSSYAIGKFTFTAYETTDVVFEVINYAETTYDFAIFSTLDKTLTSSTTVDTSNVKQSFSGKQSASIQTVTYSSVPAGTHFITVKFKKDSSQHKNNDSVRLRLRQPSISSDIQDQIVAGDKDLIASNIKSGVDIYGVVGTYTGSGSGTTVSTGSLELRAVPGEAKIRVPRLSSGSITYGTYTGGNRTISSVVLNAPFFIYMGLGSAPYIYKDTSGVTDIGSDLNDAGYYSGVLTSSSGYVDFWYDCCFDGQSKVLMADNTEKALIDVVVGDMVMTYDEITRTSAANEVTALGTVELSNIAELTLVDGTVIRMNKYHPMWTEEGWKSIVGYKGLPRLTVEDKLLNNNGGYVAIKSIEYVDTNKQTYYTLKVANNNNFYVNGYLAQGKDKD